ncbi:MAG TPA: MarR family transcriptional regulator [Aggregatilineales bacterium]|nr:MarR family transcriptional regulator [Anaerolineae bacterium]HUN09920.1 MarR family transcriptional regulator [Aggregatilineales bacterium]
MAIEPTSSSASIPHRILDVLPVVMRVVAAQMRGTRHALSSGHMPVLAALRYTTYTQSELADMMSVSNATMSNTLTALEERGWIERQRSTEDRRQVYIHLTPQGQRALVESTEDMEEHIAELTAGLDAEARQKLLDGLDVLETVFMSALMNITSSEREVEMHTRKQG